MNKRQKGFSLIELLIVVAIILIIAAIAIPNLMRSKMAANESSAASMTRTLFTAATTYSTTYGNGYPVGLANLGPASAGNATCTNAGLIDSVLAGGLKSGYSFVLTGDGANPVVGGGCVGSVTFFAGGTPQKTGTTGTRSFCVGNDGVVYADLATGAPATPCPGSPLDTK
jgi:type IV pilus assembly protein PilA